MSTISRRLALPSAIAFATLLLHCPPALSSWQHDGIPLSPPGVTAGPALGRDGTGGVFVAWANDSIHLEVHALRVQSDGSNAPGWAQGGVDIADIPPGIVYQVTGIDNVLPDGTGGAYVLYGRLITAGTNASLTRVLGSSVVPSGWPVDGMASGSTQIASDDAGGVLYAYAPYSRFGMPTPYLFQRRRENSTLAGTYAPIANSTSDDPSIDTDHAGGAIAACLCTLTGLDTTMAVHWDGSSWPGCTSGMRVVSDGDHGAFLVWLAGTTVKVCRIDQSGDPVAGWNTSGVTVGTRDVSTTVGASLARDEAGGCFVMWRSTDGFLIQRLTSAGAVASGWPASGAPIGAPASTQSVTQMVPDGTGGVYVGWGTFAQHLGPAGSPMPGWLATGDPICQALGSKTNLTAASDDAGGVYFAWRDGRTTPPRIYGQHFLSTDEIPLAVPVAPAAALAVAPLANPSTHGMVCSVTLPSAEAARLEVFDTMGRRVSERIIEGAGAGSRVTPVDVAGAKPGVYLVRLSQGARSSATRIVLVQ